ncbi:hypothetical protein CASFOL_033592 [Castilleja foliolosa]|uniref:Membrane-associated kinase regulator 6 n=1 Tax=Castilleja foliolosa TaxID=1961234 RepID=A0ABD3BZ18_9LAMI
MENSQSLATESFSYSWLPDKTPQNSNDNNHINPPENPNEKDQNFNFNFPFTSSQITPAHADEIFSGGQLKLSQPVHIDTSKTKNPKSAPQSPVSAHQVVLPVKWGKSSRRFFRGIFGILNPLIGCSRRSNRVDDIERVQFDSVVVGNKKDCKYALKKVKSCNNSAQASPRIGPSYSTNSWSCDAESSIHEAILYCKKSIEMRGFAVYTKKKRSACWGFLIIYTVLLY